MENCLFTFITLSAMPCLLFSCIKGQKLRETKAGASSPSPGNPCFLGMAIGITLELVNQLDTKAGMDFAYLSHLLIDRDAKKSNANTKHRRCIETVSS